MDDEAAELDGVHCSLLERLGAHLPIFGRRLSGKVAVVSGAGAGGDFLGIGAASSILFSAQGAQVALLDVEPARAQLTADFITELGGQAGVFPCDIRSAAACRTAVEHIVSRYDHLDVLMNNAAIARPGNVETVTDEDWKASVDVNMTGTLFLSRAAAQELKRSRGSIVNVSTIAASRAHGVAIGYAASKAAVEAMTRDMAHWLGQFGVRVNCLVPGMLHTPIGGGKTPEARERRRTGNLLGVEGSAWDAAWAAMFLACEESRWITGTTLVVDAGSTIVPGDAKRR